MVKNSRAGYTIVELMIVLTVTAVTAVSALLIVRGQQSKSEFTQAVQNFSTKLTDIANDVSTGYFPDNTTDKACEAGHDGISFVSVVHGSIGQGSNSDCVFIGKAVELGINSSDMRIISIASRRRDRDNKEIFSLNNLQNDDISPVPGLDEADRMVYGMQIDNIYYGNHFTNVWPVVVFLSGFGTKESGGSLTGSPKTDLYMIPKSSLCTPTLEASLAKPDCYEDPVPVSEDGLILCASQGGGAQVRFSLGKNGRELTISTEILDAGATC